MILKLSNGFFLVVFLLSAAVQYNDPDTLPWIAIYLAAAGMCLLSFSPGRSRWLPASLLMISLLWIGYLLPGIVGQVSPQEVFESISMQTRDVEEAREIGGLGLIALWAAVLTVSAPTV